MKLNKLNFALAAMLAGSALTLGGCDDGADGVDGAPGATGTAGVDGTDGIDGVSASALTRFATAPSGAEFTGMFLTDNNFFFNVQHPANQTAKVFVTRGDMQNVGEIQPLRAPQTDAEKEQTRIAYGDISMLGEDSTSNPDGVLGNIYAIDGTLIKSSNDPDFNAFVPLTAGDDSEGYLFTNWEDRPGGMSRMKVKYTDGAWTVTDQKMIDFSSVEGTWVNCFGTLSPWTTPLTSEELYFDNTADWYGSSTIDALDTYLGDTNRPNPYRYGYIVEITNPTVTSPIPVKHFALGRFSHENAVVMPDQKTVYMSDDGTDVVFFKFVADVAGDLSAGTLYAAKVTQDATSDESEAGFDITWIELASGNNADIEAQIANFDDNENYITDAEIATAATDADATNDWIAFVETRKFAKALGATAEFRKMEGVNINHDRVVEQLGKGESAYMYMAMSEIGKGMSDTSGDIQLNYNACGVVYQMELPADYNVTRMEPVVIGGPYDADAAENRCHVDSISNPDNLVVLDDGRVIIGEDTSKHANNAMWVWDPQDGTFVIKSTGSAYSAE